MAAEQQRAEKIGIYLTEIERGKGNVSLVNIERLTAALAWRLTELFQRVETA